jgi:hypothetical protein
LTRKITRLQRESTIDRSPEVVVDFECENDLLFIFVANVGTSSAHQILIEFDKEITDFKDAPLSKMDAFHRLEFLSPGRKIKVFVDKFSSYIQRRQPMRIKFLVSYSDTENQKRCDAIRHNLAIFKGIATPGQGTT